MPNTTNSVQANIIGTLRIPSKLQLFCMNPFRNPAVRMVMNNQIENTDISKNNS